MSGEVPERASRILKGSQAKTAYALKMNAAKMIEEAGLEHVGFLTLTVGDSCAHGFEQVHDPKEASRRINNLNRRVLKDLFEKAIIATERHQSGAIHYHVLGVLRGRPDIRTGFDFAAVADRDYRSVSQELRNRWELLREVLPDYGFGRAELMPVRKTGEAVAEYIAKYIEKNIRARRPEDKGHKLVRYLGWNGEQLKANEFSWAGEKSRKWRRMARRVAATIGCGSPEECAEALGSRWAYVLTVVGLSVGGGSLAPGEPMDLPQRMVVHGELMHVARRKGWRKPYLEAAHRREGVEWGRGIAEETILDAEYFFEHGPGAVTGGTLGGEGVPSGGALRNVT